MEIRPAFLAQVKVCLELYMFIYLFTFILLFFAFCSQHCQGVYLHRGWKWSPARLLQKALHWWCDWRHQDFQLCSQNSGKKIENIENKFIFWGGFMPYMSRELVEPPVPDSLLWQPWCDNSSDQLYSTQFVLFHYLRLHLCFSFALFVVYFHSQAGKTCTLSSIYNIYTIEICWSYVLLLRSSVIFNLWNFGHSLT